MEQLDRALIAVEEAITIYRQLAEARAAHEQAIDSVQTNQAPAAAARLGMLLAKQGDMARARAAYQLAIDSDQPDIVDGCDAGPWGAACLSGRCGWGSGRLPAGHRFRTPRGRPARGAGARAAAG